MRLVSLRPVSILVAAFLLPAAAHAERAVLVVGVRGGELAPEPAEAVGELLASLGLELLDVEALGRVVPGPIDREPAPGELEAWASALESDLVVSLFFEADEGFTAVRVTVLDRASRGAVSASESAPPEELGAVAHRLVASLLGADERRHAEREDEAPLPAERLEPPPPPPPPPVPEPPARPEGRVGFVLNSTALGLSLMAGVLLAADVRDVRLFAPILLLGGGGGLAVSLLVSRHRAVSPGDNSIVGVGGWWGAGMGILVAGAAGFDELRWLATGSVVGQALGLAAGIAAAAFTEVSAGDGAVIHSGALWGLFSGGVLASLVSHRDPRASHGMVLAGLSAGLAAGVLSAHLVEISAGRAAIIDLCGFIGVLLGASVGTPIIIDSQSAGHVRAYAGVLLGAASLGLGLGALLTRRWDVGQDEPGAPAPRPSRTLARIPIPVPTIIPAAAELPGSRPAFGVQLVGGAQ